MKDREDFFFSPYLNILEENTKGLYVDRKTTLFEYHILKVAQSCLTLSDPMDYTVPRILQARILEWVAFFLLQGIFPTQGSNSGLPHCWQILYQLSHRTDYKQQDSISIRHIPKC